MNRLHVLILGSSGYLGGRVERELSSKPFVQISRAKRLSKAKPFEFTLEQQGNRRTGDIREPSFFQTDKPFDVIISLAAEHTVKTGINDVTNLILANSWLPSVLGSLASQGGAHVIHTGTYSHKSDFKSYDPQTFYAATKRSGELFLEYFSSNTSMTATILHTYDIYGPEQPHKKIIPSIVAQLRSGGKIEITPGEQEFRPVFVDDMVSIISHLAIERKSAIESFEELDVYGPELFLIKDLPEIIASELGLRLEPSQVEKTVEYRDREIMKFKPCHSLVDYVGQWTKLSEGLRSL